MSDTISRQAAIDYCYQLINVEYEQGSDEMNYGRERVSQTETILHHLELMPPAQPQIVRCKDCKHWTKESDHYGKCDFMTGCLSHRSESCEKYEKVVTE